jgi:hypothetical protein
MKAPLPAFLLLIISIPGFSQQLNVKYGEISMKEMEMKRYELDSSASAVILFDKGNFYLTEDLEAVFKRHVRIKFFDKEAFDDWAKNSVYLDRQDEGISKLKATTYNLENGVIVPSEMESTSVFKSKFDKYVDQVKFALPNVKAGSVIEYSYTIRTRATLLPPWRFQRTIPTIWSEFEVIFPKSFAFRKDLQGFNPLSVHEDNGNGKERWVMENVPAFKEEPFLTTPEDFISRIDFYLTEVFIPGRPLINTARTWPGISKEWAESPDFGGLIKGSNFLNDIVTKITAGITDPQQKMQVIFDYVKQNVEWNQFSDKIPDHPLKKVLEEKKGSSSEINTLLISMLQKADLEAEPVLISTRDHGMIRPFIPSSSQFNEVICMVKIGEKTKFLDGTDRHLSLNALPERCLNGAGLVISKTDPRWVDVVSGKAKTSISATLTLNEDGELEGKLDISRDGTDAGDMRKSYVSLGEKEYVTKSFSSKAFGIEKSSFENIDKANESAKESHQLLVTDHAQAGGSTIYLNPFILSRMEENPFKSTTRDYPVDFSTPFDNFYTLKVSIPEGFEVEELPKQKLVVLPENGGKFTYSATQLGNTISFVSMITLNRSKYSVEEYPYLKEFYDIIIAKQNEQIVFRRK